MSPITDINGDGAHLLVIDDDTRLRDLLRRFLSERGYLVTAVADAAEARAHLATMDFDLLVVDVMMPGEDGVSLTRSIRQTSDVPVLILTARDDPDDRITGLSGGADDYLTKPFDPRELLLRINAILRRRPRPAVEESPRQIRFGDFTFDLERQELTFKDEPVYLTTAEQDLLQALARQAGDAVSRESLADVLGIDGGARAIDVQMTRLRKKIEADPRQPRYLLTVRGTGYTLRPG